MPSRLDGLLWLLLLLGPFLILQRRLHREIQSIFLLLTRNKEISLVLFSFLFLPGVLLHEFSHFLMAKGLLVRTGRFSLIPQPLPDGRLQLGYVETAHTDLARDALIGVAPLLAGGLFVTFAGLSRLRLSLLWEALPSGNLAQSIQAVHQQPDFWLWFYLVFVVSSTMLPSASDRRAWSPIVLILALLIIVTLIAGAGPWLLGNVMPYLNQALRILATIFGISLALHLVLLVPLWLIRLSISKITRLSVV